MEKFKFSQLWLFISIIFIFMLMGTETAFVQQVPPGMALERGIFFSTEEDFVAGIQTGDGNPIISDGDLLHSSGYVYMRNHELLDKCCRVHYDLGLDAVDVIDVKKKIVAFSTELDDPNGSFKAGDLLFTNGASLPNFVLLKSFKIPRHLDLGLDAVQFIGKKDDIVEFIDAVRVKGKRYWIEKPERLMGHLKELDIDIWFSTEGTAPTPNNPGFLDGDLLSAKTGTIILKNHDALPGSVPAGIPDRGVDFGMDAAACIKREKKESIYFSTEILYEGRLNFTDGDILLSGYGVVMNNSDLINAFEPKTEPKTKELELGLDALSLEIDTTACRFTKIGGVYVNPSTWDFTTGYVDPDLSGPKDHPFGSWVSIRGVLSPDAVEHRIQFRSETGAYEPIRMPASLNWKVWCWWPACLSLPFPLTCSCGFFGCWVHVVIDGDGWMSTEAWKYLWAWDKCGNGDLIFVNWNTSGLNGKYFLRLQIKDSDENERTCQEVPIQIDNTRPEIELSDNLECKTFHCKDLPLDVYGGIYDEHFSHYTLSFRKFGMTSSIQFAQGHYNDPPPLCATGTVGSVPGTLNIVKLGELDIAVKLGIPCKKVKGGRYTVFLNVYDRSILGHFSPTTNWVMDGHTCNYSWVLTNFEFYP